MIIRDGVSRPDFLYALGDILPRKLSKKREIFIRFGSIMVKNMKGAMPMELLLYSAAHFFTDGLCAATLFGRLGAGDAAMLIFLYNTLAFST